MAAQFGSMVKRMHAGRAAQSGLYAAQLAGAGFTGIVNVFESEYGGFCTTFSRSHDRFNLAELTAGFGTVWQTMNVALKFYSCVGSNHSTLDAIREIKAEYAFGAGDVATITVRCSQATMNHVGWKYVPQGFTAAQLNLSYCVATLLIDGEVFVEQFTEEKLTTARAWRWRTKSASCTIRRSPRAARNSARWSSRDRSQDGTCSSARARCRAPSRVSLLESE